MGVVDVAQDCGDTAVRSVIGGQVELGEDAADVLVDGRQGEAPPARPRGAAALNLLGIGVAYGVLVTVFEWGWGAGRPVRS